MCKIQSISCLLIVQSQLQILVYHTLNLNLSSRRNNNPRIGRVHQLLHGDDFHLCQEGLQQALVLALHLRVPYRVSFVDHLAEVVSTLQQEVDTDSPVGFVLFNGGPIHELGCHEALLTVLEADLHLDVPGLVKPLFAILQNLQHGEQLLTGNIEADEQVLEGQHVVVVLVLDHARHPLGAEAARVDDHEASRRHRLMNESGEQVGHGRLLVLLLDQVDLIVDYVLQEGGHLGSPLNVVYLLKLGLGDYIFFVELPVDQVSGCLQLLLGQVVAPAQVFEHFLADWDGPFDERTDDFLVVIELQVHHVEVVAPVDGAHVGDALVVVVGHPVAMPLHDAVNDALRQLVDQQGYLILRAGLLLSILGPVGIDQVDGAGIADVTQDQNSMGSCLPEFGAFLDDGLLVLEEPVHGELAARKPRSSCRGLQSRQADDADFNPVGQGDEGGAFLLWQEIQLARLGAQVGGQVQGLLTVHVGQQELGPEVELVVAQGRPLGLDEVIEIVHDFPVADELGGLDSTLELVASIEIDSISLVLLDDGLDEAGHVDESPVLVFLAGVLTRQQGRESLAVDVVAAYDGHSELSLNQAGQQAEQSSSQQFSHGNINIILGMQGKASYIVSSYFIINSALVLAYPYLRLRTEAGDRSLKNLDSFGFTYENSIIYTVLALAIIAYSRSTSNAQFFLDLLTVGKIGVACLLFFAKFEYCLYYIVVCVVLWTVVPYPKYRAPNKFISIKTQEEFEQLMEKKVSRKEESSKFLHFQYRNKMMYFVEFYADWALSCTFTKQLWYGYSNKYATEQLQFLSVNVSKLPQLAEKYKINTSGFTKQLPTVMVIEDGEEVLRFPPVDKDNKVAKVAKYNYKILLRYFDLESRYLQTRK